MTTELIKLTLAFRGLSDDPEANDESVDLGEEELLDPDEAASDDDDDDADDKGGEMMGGATE